MRITAYRKGIVWGLLGSAGFAVFLAAWAQTSPTSGKHHFSIKSRAETISEDAFTTAVYHLTAEITEGRYTLADEIWQPGMNVPPHSHKRHAETFYIVSGRVEWTVGGETQELTAGDLVFIPPNTVHAVRVLGNESVHTLMLYDPGGYELNLERESRYSEEQLQNSDVQAELMRLNDFNPVAP